MTSKTIIFIAIISLILSALNIIGIMYPIEDSVTRSMVDKKMEQNNVSFYEENDCKSEDLMFTAYCLRKNLEIFYNYNLTNVGELLTLDELKSVGGVCSHYSNYYKDNLIKAGFYSETYTLQTKGYAHEVAMAWDENFSTLCILDQSEVICR